MELTSEATFIAEFPFTIHNFECQIFVRWSRMKSQYGKVFVFSTRRLLKESKDIRYIRKESYFKTELKIDAFDILTRKYCGVVFLSIKSG